MEASLTRRAQAGDNEALDALVRAHLPSIRKLAMKLRWWGVPVDDLVQEGVIGLLQALPKFQPERGVRLLTFSVRGMRQRMLLSIALHRGQGLAAGGTVWGREFFRLRREIEAARRHGEDPVGWLVDRVGVTRETALATLRVQAPMLPWESEGPLGWATDSRTPDPEQQVLVSERARLRTHALQEALEELTDRERLIVEGRWMADPPPTYRGLGARLGISGERVKQLEVRTMRRLRAKLIRQGLRVRHGNDFVLEGVVG